jgi:hypothetical protein
MDVDAALVTPFCTVLALGLGLQQIALYCLRAIDHRQQPRPTETGAWIVEQADHQTLLPQPLATEAG